MRRAMIVALWVSVGASFSHARPVLWYPINIDSSTQADIGIAPQANGTKTGSAAILSGVSPNNYSCGCLDLTPGGAGANNYLTSTNDVQKIDALLAMTVTMWINLRADPAAQDCLISDNPSGIPPATQGGWDIRIANPLGGGSFSASNFSLSFSKSKSSGSILTTEGSTSAALGASNQWVFIALTFDAARLQRYYKGTESGGVAQLGSGTIFSTTLSDNATAPRVGGASSEPSTDRSPPAYIDDVRIYDSALTLAQLEQVRIENLQILNMNAVPGFFEVPHLAGSTSCASVPQAVSANGNAVVGYVPGPSGLEAFRWQNGIWTLLGDLTGGDFHSNARGVSPDGSAIICTGTTETSSTAAFLWKAGVITPLGDFPGGEDVNLALGVNADGTRVSGGSVDRTGNKFTPYVWAGGMLNPIPYLPGGDEALAYDISADGTVLVGSSESAAGYEAFRYENGQTISLGDLNGGIVGSRGWRISADKQLVVGDGYSALGNEAVIFRGGRVFSLGELAGGAYYSSGQGISAHGGRVVGYSQTAVGQEAILWDRAHGLRRLQDALQIDYGLDLTWWRCYFAAGISQDGSVIAAWASNGASGGITLIAKLPPLPYLGDFNGDNHVDQLDLGIFRMCDTGQGVPYNPASLPPGCTMTADTLNLIPADLDWDGDVDMDDFSIFQRCYSGPAFSPPVECRG